MITIQSVVSLSLLRQSLLDFSNESLWLIAEEVFECSLVEVISERLDALGVVLLVELVQGGGAAQGAGTHLQRHREPLFLSSGNKRCF